MLVQKVGREKPEAAHIMTTNIGQKVHRCTTQQQHHHRNTTIFEAQNVIYTIKKSIDRFHLSSTIRLMMTSTNRPAYIQRPNVMK